MRRGLTAKDDLDIGPRLLEAAPEGPAHWKPIKPHLIDLVQGYYKIMGWDPKSGKPLKKTLKRLSIP